MAGPIRHVAFVGSVNVQKGALVFEELLGRFPAKRHPELVWSVLGGGEREILRRLRRRPAVRVRGYYRTGCLATMLRLRRVDLALLLSIAPESYGMTLDECRLAGVPVLAFDQGALGERLRRDGGGLALPSVSVEELADRLSDILDHGWAATERPPRPIPDARAAARACAEIYRGL